MNSKTNNPASAGRMPALVRPFRVGDRVSYHNGKRRGYGTIYAETPEQKNGMGITVPQQISISTGHPRYQKIGLDVDYADVRICRNAAPSRPEHQIGAKHE